ncbi:hypothetical protein I79_010360 [Cricetulus griseus]|uniref:Uncharacterized protein n=1 Tax=Cricetulus griseus TaxID=10029 RepID=G3HI93_CRIGR|nr:hypothetical protein I79_010360 [Cricetulus griseus]
MMPQGCVWHCRKTQDAFEGLLCFLDVTEQILPPHAPNCASLPFSPSAGEVLVEVTATPSCSCLVQPDSLVRQQSFQGLAMFRKYMGGSYPAPQIAILENTQHISRNKASPH